MRRSASRSTLLPGLALLGGKLFELLDLFGRHLEVGLNVLAHGELDFALGESAALDHAESALTLAASLTLSAGSALAPRPRALGEDEGGAKRERREQEKTTFHATLDALGTRKFRVLQKKPFSNVLLSAEWLVSNALEHRVLKLAPGHISPSFFHSVHPISLQLSPALRKRIQEASTLVRNSEIPV
jgi:hypothetical protein